MEIQLFFLNIPWVAASLWFISRVLKKLLRTIFASVPITSTEERIFRSPYGTIFTDVTLFYLILINLDVNSHTELMATVLDSTSL